MSIDYHVGLAFGLEVPTQQILDTFMVATPAPTRIEPRWDPKTGARVEDEVIVTGPAVRSFNIGGREARDLLEVVELMAQMLGCQYTTSYTNAWSGQADASYMFCPKTEHQGYLIDEGHLTVEAKSFTVTELLSLEKETRRIEDGLRKLGLSPGEPKVRATLGIF